MISIYTQKTKMNKKKLTFFELWHKQTAAEHSIKFKLQKKQTGEKEAILTKQVWYKLITVCQQLDWNSKRSTESESGRSVWGPQRCHETRGPQSQIRQSLEPWTGADMTDQQELWQTRACWTSWNTGTVDYHGSVTQKSKGNTTSNSTSTRSW